MLRKVADKRLMYIGDQEGDVEFTRNIENELGGKSKVTSIKANYSGANTGKWKFKPNFELNPPTELLNMNTFLK